MRYHYKLKEYGFQLFGGTYECNHPIYDQCTLYKAEDGRGLAVIQQYADGKKTYWAEIHSYVTNYIFLQPGFKTYFDERAKLPDEKGLYPTVTVRQIMWALRMPPLKKERWETTFTRKEV